MSYYDIFCEDIVIFDLLLYILKVIGNYEIFFIIIVFIELFNLIICLYFIFLSFKIMKVFGNYLMFYIKMFLYKGIILIY